MAKKRRRVISKQRRLEKEIAKYPTPKFAVGDTVQVNDGVMDANWNDLPLGGWTGEITLIHREANGPKYDVRWNKETLEQAHPVYKALAKLEGLRFDEYTLIDENDLHLFTGGPVVSTEPVEVTQYTERPFDPTKYDDRLRMIFDAKPLDWYPMLGDGGLDNEFDNKLLRRYYDYLTANMPFPFRAIYVVFGIGEPLRRPFTVEKLIDPDAAKQAGFDVSCGLYCSGTDPTGKLFEVPLEKVLCGGSPQQQFIKDYHSWIGTYHYDDEFWKESP